MKLLDKRVQREEFVKTHWVATVEAGVTRKDVLDPEFWSYVSMKFKPYDTVEIRTDDSDFYGQYVILSCDRTYASLYELSFHKLSDEAGPRKGSLYEYKWGGPYGKHGIVRTSDNAMMVNKLETKAEALKWLTAHLEKVDHVNIAS
jgi:hypothetical protein